MEKGRKGLARKGGEPRLKMEDTFDERARTALNAKNVEFLKAGKRGGLP